MGYLADCVIVGHNLFYYKIYIVSVRYLIIFKLRRLQSFYDDLGYVICYSNI